MLPPFYHYATTMLNQCHATPILLCWKGKDTKKVVRRLEGKTKWKSCTSGITMATTVGERSRVTPPPVLLLYFAYILGIFWVHFGYILVTFWLHFGYIFGYILIAFWLHFGYISVTMLLHLLLHCWCTVVTLLLRCCYAIVLLLHVMDTYSCEYKHRSDTDVEQTKCVFSQRKKKIWKSGVTRCGCRTGKINRKATARQKEEGYEVHQGSRPPLENTMLVAPLTVQPP